MIISSSLKLIRYSDASKKRKREKERESDKDRRKTEYEEKGPRECRKDVSGKRENGKRERYMDSAYIRGLIGTAGVGIQGGERAHHGLSARERILTFSVVERASWWRQEEGDMGCARDGAVASPCRILQYPWLRRPRGFPAKYRKRDRTARRRPSLSYRGG